MDKEEFIKAAPQYYSLAIIAYFANYASRAVSQRDLSQHYSERDHEIDEDVYYLNKPKIFDLAVSWLEHEGIVDVARDIFGPPLISPSMYFDDKVLELTGKVGFPLSKYKSATNGKLWLYDALRAIDFYYQSLRITDADFDEPDGEWEPLPLEREDPQFQIAIAAVDDTTEKVRSDNGYAATFPEERDYVLESITALSRKLKTAPTISLAYLRQYGFRPLATLLRRFGGTAIGLVASVAKEALREWLKRQGITLLDDWF